MFRRLALALPEATEGAHGGHPDFRVGNKVFASLGAPDAGAGMVKLTPEQQEMVMGAEPAVFSPSAGAWGRRGYTRVHLAAVDPNRPSRAPSPWPGAIPHPRSCWRQRRREIALAPSAMLMLSRLRPRLREIARLP